MLSESNIRISRSPIAVSTPSLVRILTKNLTEFPQRAMYVLIESAALWT